MYPSGRTQGLPRRSVLFATIEEEVEYERNGSVDVESSNNGDSIVMDGLDPQVLQQNMSSLEVDGSGQLMSSTIVLAPDAQPRRRVSLFQSRSRTKSSDETSSGAGIFVSALRRFTFSGEGGTSSTRSGGNPTSSEGGPSRRDGRVTLFTHHRRSFDDRSSLTFDGDGDSAPSYAGDSHCGCLSIESVNGLRQTVSHPAWWATSLFFIVFMLFGPAIQVWLPKTVDPFVDGVLIAGALFLGVDIIIRCVVDKSYFFSLGQRENASRTRRTMCKLQLHVASVRFWMDTFGLVAVYVTISFVNPAWHKTEFVETLTMEKDAWHASVAHTTPLDYSSRLLFSLGRVALMGRFIRTSDVLHIPGGFSGIAYFFPGFWIKKLTSNCRQKMRREDQKQAVTSKTKGDLPHGGSRPTLDDSDSFHGSNRRDRSTINSSRRYSGSEKDDQLEISKENPGPTALKDTFKCCAKKTPDSAVASANEESDRGVAARLFGNEPNDPHAHVGFAMRELTGQRVAAGIMLATMITVLCDWHEINTTRQMTMLMLYGPTANEKYAATTVESARECCIPSLFNYTRLNATSQESIYSFSYNIEGQNIDNLRAREVLNIFVYSDGSDIYTSGRFDISQNWKDGAKVDIVSQIFVLILWVFAVASFGGPVMTLVVKPIEIMTKLLSLMVKDPLGYDDTPQFKQLKDEQDQSSDADAYLWPPTVLKGMETNFLMSTILRIGSLMKVGFGNAGVDIIRNNLERGHHKDVLLLSKQGGEVSCIFLFCDIRQFTDATECLQEEVFVFTNKIAGVVHRICHSYGGNANKNIGDAFLLSWLLDEPPEGHEKESDYEGFESSPALDDGPGLYALHDQAEKALLAVIRISMALHYNDYFLEGMGEDAKTRLLAKLGKREGPVVKLGFGLHAGNAVQGAIGSQRKLDATYISESVERAEFLEGATKKYGVPMLMSCAFFQLLDPQSQRRCRKIDQLIMLREEDKIDDDMVDPHAFLYTGEKMDIYTFDMDIDSLWAPDESNFTLNSDSDDMQRAASSGVSPASWLRSTTADDQRSSLRRRSSVRTSWNRSTRRLSKDNSNADLEKALRNLTDELAAADAHPSKTLVLPRGVHRYSDRDWHDSDIKKIRRAYVSNGIIFPKYKEGLDSFCKKDWEHAKRCFETVLAQRDDGPSKFFLERIADHDGVPPRTFIGYTIEDVS